MEGLEVKNLKSETIEQIKQDGKLFNRVFVSFELENITKKSFKNIKVKIMYKTAGKDNNYEMEINHVDSEETFTYGYEQYLTKEILDLSSEITYEEEENDKREEFEVLKFNKDNALLFKLVNTTGKNINYARAYIEFIKNKKAFTGTNILLSGIKKDDEREIEFVMPESFKCDSYVLKVDYSDDKIMSVYQFGKKYVEVMNEYMEATNIDDKIAAIGNEVSDLSDDINYYDNYKPKSYGKALCEAISDTFSGIADIFCAGLIFVLEFIIPVIIITIILAAAGLPVLEILLGLLIIGVPVISIIVIIVKSIKIMKENLSKEEVQKESDALQDKVTALREKLGKTDKRLNEAVIALDDLALKNPQYPLPPVETVSKLFLSSLTSAIEETDISWEEVMRVTKEKYYEAYAENQRQIEKLQGEIAEAERREEERNLQMQRDFEEQQFRERMLNEQRAANYARQSEMERQTREMERANQDSWERAQRQTDVLNAIYRDNYYNH